MFGFNKHDIKLALNLFKMNVRDRYLGSALGSFWAVANPLFMLALYTYVFGFIFKVKLPGAETTLAYVIWLISGYGPWIAISEALMGATTSVVSASGIVKNIAFKTEILPIAAALTSVVSLVISMVFIVILVVFEGKPVSIYVITLPLVIAIQFFFVISVGFFFATMHVFVRDFGIALPNLLNVILFLTPIFYPIASMPRIVQILSNFNPVYSLVEAYRAPLIYNRLPDFVLLLYVFVLSAGLCIVGLRVFRRAKGHFDGML